LNRPLRARHYDEMVSDIPVGSPPAPPGRHAAPGGWYPDPVNAAQERYWDGWQWSRNTRPGAASPGAPGYSQAPYTSYPARDMTRPPLERAGTRTVQATMTADGVPLASWWWRVLAVLIDNWIIFAIVTVITFPVWRSVYETMVGYFNTVLDAQQSGLPPPPPMVATDLISGADQLIVTSVTLGVAMLYHVGFLRWKSATPGKLLCGLRVVPVDRGRDPGPLAWNSIFIRAAVWVLPSTNLFLSFITVIDVLFPLWHPKRQALHDMAAKTQVVRTR
jgi:uncharacterized RDD family membrane protein YckC